MDFDAQNLFAQWEKLKSQFKIFVLAKSLTKETQEVQIANLLMKMGAESVPVYEQFVWGSEVEKTLAATLEKFDQHFRPVKNVIFERLRFNQIVQTRDQSIHDFITALQTQAESCEYGTMKADLVRDRIVVGVNSTRLRQYLLNLEGDLTLDICIRKSKQWLSQEKELDDIKSPPIGEDVDALFTRPTDARKDRNQNKSHFNKKPGSQPARSSRQARPGEHTCRRCGLFTKHQESDCPARTSKCTKCDKVGHWAPVCRSTRTTAVDYVEDDESLGAL